MTTISKDLTGLSPEEKRALLTRLIRARTTRPESFPVSFAQQRLWFLDQLAPGNPFYNVAATLPLAGHLDVPALEHSLNEIVRRHEALRTTFREVDGQPHQVVAPTLTLALPVIDLRALPSSERDAQTLLLATEEAQAPFDLARGPLVRTSLLRVGEYEHVFLLTMHHIVCDGWSMGVFFNELTLLYTAFCQDAPSPLAELSLQYADFAVWQRQWLQREVLEEQLTYWKTRLAGLSVLDLPTDRPRPPVQSFQGAHYPVALSKDLSEELRALSQRQGVTLFMTLLAAFQILLQRYTGQDDIVIGTYIANRNRTEIEDLIGFFVNSLVLRTDLSGDPTVREVLGRVTEVALGAYAHQDLPFEKLVEELQPERDLSRNPLFQVTFQLLNLPATTTTAGTETSAPPLEIERGTAIFDIAFGLCETPQGLMGQIEYSTDLFEPETIGRMVEHYRKLLEAIVGDPDQHISALPMLGKAERQQLLIAWNDTASKFPRDAGVHQLFEAQAHRTPDAVAFSCGSQHLCYEQLNVRANQLAHYLRAKGVMPETPVAIALDRSLEMAVSLLGILKAGGAYVPLDPTYPAERLAFMLEDSQAPVLVTDTQLRHRFGRHDALTICVDDEQPAISAASAADPTTWTSANSLLYVIYTSGSTGTPKGVLGGHRAAVNRFDWMWRTYPFGSDEVCCQKTALSFVDSVWEIFGPLLNGIRSVILADDVVKDPYMLVGALASQGVTRIVLVPSLLRVILNTGLDLRTELRRLRYWITSGEALPFELLQQFREALPEAVLLNLYGSSEVAGDATCYDTREELSWSCVPIGRPIANTRVYVLDRRLQPVPVGVPGELHVGGEGLARGYLNRPELTAERFIPDPFSTESGARLFKTGDVARFGSTGSLEFLGRTDDQVKIRGFRVEPGEIEAALRQHPSVRKAVVMARAERDADPQLVAYVVQDDASSGQPASDVSDEQTQRWQMVWDETYKQTSAPADPTFNITGWTSSYTGEQIPPDEMREWVDGTVERILALRPRRVLEIGCGSGLLLFRIAPHCAQYYATDFAPAALRYLEPHLASRELRHVSLLERRADDLSGFDAGSVDAVILNSMVQYFPSIDYLVALLEQCARLVAPGGFIFVGDVRSLPLLKALHTGVETYRAPASLHLEQLEQRVHKRMAQEQELVVDPTFFTALQQHLPAIGEVRVQLRRGRQHNELSCFRYDVTLRLADETIPSAECEWLEWSEKIGSLAELRNRLRENHEPMFGIRHVPNARVFEAVTSLGLIANPGAPETVGELRKSLAALDGKGVDPEALWALGKETNHAVDIRWIGSRPDGSYDALFDGRDLSAVGAASAVVHFSIERPRVRPWRTYANDPREAAFAQQLVPELRRFLQDRLPEYMLPSAFVLLTSLPMTPNGKVDRRALPAPDRGRRETQGVYVAPRSETEKLLVTIWSELLGVDQVGVRDDFFTELGGHSLLATQVISRVRYAFQVDLPLRAFFETPTVAGLAAAIEGAYWAAQAGQQPIEAQGPDADIEQGEL